MYQFNMSIDKKREHWFYDAEKVFNARIKGAGGIAAAKRSGGRLNVSVACENDFKAAITAVLREHLTEILLGAAKTEYLEEALVLPALKNESYKILLLTLVVFDRDCERKLIDKSLRLSDRLALDGFFNFKMTELKKRWNDIAELAASNSRCLAGEDALNELLRFLMSAVTPKVTRLEVIKSDDRYRIKGALGDSGFEYSVADSDRLLAYLINIAPVELTLRGSFDDDKLYRRLVGIFDAKSAELQ
jgi:hypothetical protein